MKFATGLFFLPLLLSWAGVSATASDQATIEAAKKEGSLMIYNSMTPSQMQLIINAFNAKYPFIDVKVYRAVGERLLTKVFTEAQAGRHDFDVLQSGDTQAYFLKKKNLLGKYVSSGEIPSENFCRFGGLLGRHVQHAENYRLQHEDG